MKQLPGALQIESLREGRIVCGHPGRSPDIDFLLSIVVRYCPDNY